MRTIKKTYKPEEITVNGATLKNYFEADLKGYPITNRNRHTIAAELKDKGLTVAIVEVLQTNLKGRTDLHGQEYKPSIYIYADLHTDEQFNQWREKVEFWKKQFAPRTNKWMKETRAKNNRPKASELWTGNEAAQNQAIKELLN